MVNQKGHANFSFIDPMSEALKISIQIIKTCIDFAHSSKDSPLLGFIRIAMRGPSVIIIRVIKNSGIAAVIVDKNVAKLTELADRHMILVKGRVVFEGDGVELLSNPERLNRHLGV